VKAIQKIGLIAAVVIIMMHNFVGHNDHEGHFHEKPAHEEGILEFLKDVFAFAGGDETIENITKHQHDEYSNVAVCTNILPFINCQFVLEEINTLPVGDTYKYSRSFTKVSKYLKKSNHFRGSPYFQS